MSKSKEKAIILNHMFSGDYLVDNIGHEVINLILADDNLPYIYLCKDGRFSESEHFVEEMIFVNSTNKKYRYEIIGIAIGLKYNNDNFNFNPTYGGVNVHEIFKFNKEQQSICVTFQAEKVLMPSSKYYIEYHVEDGDVEDIIRENAEIIFLKQKKENNKYSYSPSRQLREYIVEDNNKYSDYSKLSQLINNAKSNWRVLDNKISDIDIQCVYPLLYSEFYGVNCLENAYSNAIKSILDRYPILLTDFCGYLKNKSIITNNIEVHREWTYKKSNKKSRIDLLIELEHDIIVVENKIMSDVNGSQLKDYKNIISQYNKDGVIKKNCHFILLTPNHNPIYKKGWTTIYYKDIHDFIEKNVSPLLMSDIYLFEFYHAIKPHSESNYNFSIMKKRFYKAIQSIKALSNINIYK